MTKSPVDWFMSQSKETRQQIIREVVRDFREEIEYNERHGLPLLTPFGFDEILDFIRPPAQLFLEKEKTVSRQYRALVQPQMHEPQRLKQAATAPVVGSFFERPKIRVVDGVRHAYA